jgi:NADPH-dependent 2,4-dienoyl-CoA reductase/sulfur reductase-like enzyme
VLVVGAGLAGLAAARTLRRRHRVVLIDRLPVAGGVMAHQDGPAHRLQAECRAAGVTFRLGATALRWSDERRLLVADPAGFEWLGGERLILAGGLRPATPAELGIVGDRVSGVFPATVAFHLLEAGVTLGRRTVVAGAGHWAARICGLLQRRGSRVTLLPDAEQPLAPAAETWPGWRVVATHGMARLQAVTVAHGESTARLLCDALVLAAQMHPMRNVDGAVLDGGHPGLSFLQPDGDRMSADAVIGWAEERAARIMDEAGAGNEG